VPVPAEWLSSPPVVAPMLFAPKGAESLGCCRMGVIGALVLFPPLFPLTINLGLSIRVSTIEYVTLVTGTSSSGPGPL